MTQLPFNQVAYMPPSITAPGRRIVRIVRKALPDGRVLEWVWKLRTEATPDMKFATFELESGPVLACSCSPLAPEDVALCSADGCRAVVCASKHAATCSSCGLVFGAECLQGIVLDGMPYMTCKACARKLTSSALRKVVSAVGSWIWS